jgi:hypothetical protein
VPRLLCRANWYRESVKAEGARARQICTRFGRPFQLFGK